MICKIRGGRVNEYAYYVNKLRQNVGLETWIWRRIVTSQRPHTTNNKSPYATEDPPWKFSAYATVGPLSKFQPGAPHNLNPPLVPGQEASLAPPGSNLRSHGSKCNVFRKSFASKYTEQSTCDHPQNFVAKCGGQFSVKSIKLSGRCRSKVL